MASFRKPKGTFTRPAPDWFADNLAMIGWQDLQASGGSGGFVFTFSLFNNDTIGRNLWVYRVAGSWDGTAGILCDYFHGIFGSQVSVASAVNPRNATPPGVLYEQRTHYPLGGLVPDIPNPLTVISSVFTAANVGGDWPLFIIPPGFSARFSNDEFCQDAGIGIWYVPFANT